MTDEKNIDPIQEMLRLLNNCSNLKRWNFQENFRSLEKKILIFNSEFCRIKLVWGGWDYNGGNSISVFYGRSHAPNEGAKMNWYGEECYAWHEFENVLHFLDGRLPAEVAKKRSPSSLTEKYYEEEFRKKFHRRQPEWLMQMHDEVWGHYGVKFFEVFDLRKPDIWGKYQVFLKDVFDIRGRPSFIKPSGDKVC